jgi:hypothetical protein
MRAPPPRRELVRPADVQESCVGRALPGEAEQTAGPPAVIDGNPRTSWHCDGDGARLRPPQSLAVFFPHVLNLIGVSVIGYDPIRPCRYVILTELVIGGVGYQFPLPAAPYPQMRWFALPSARADRATLVVLRTAVPDRRLAVGCADTAIAEVAFAARR